MQDVTTKNFGLLIAYLIPGFGTLWGLSAVFPPLRLWLLDNAQESPTVGGFLYLTLACLTAGLVVSTIRWLVVDRILHHSGVKRPNWDLQHLAQRISAFDFFVENHYRYYQFYANSLVAMTIAYVAHRWSRIGGGEVPQRWIDVGFVLIALLFLFASRDTLKNYYERVEAAVGSIKAKSSAD